MSLRRTGPEHLAAAPNAVRSGRLVAVIACAAQLLNAVNIGACPLMLPAVARTLGGDAGALSWLVSSYAIAFGGLVLWGGGISDSLGSTRVLAGGFLTSATGALIAAVAPNAAVLVMARVVQGVGAALAVPGGMASLIASSDNPGMRSRRLAWFAAAGALGFAAGALAGGVVSDWIGWRSVFLAQLGVAAVCAAITLRAAPRGHKRPGSLVQWSSLSASLALALLVSSMYLGPRLGWLDPITLIGGGLTVLMFVGAVFAERTSRRPLVSRSVRRTPGLGRVLASTGLLYAAWAGAYYYGAVALQESAGLSMTAAALWLAPLAIGALTGARTAAAVLGRWHARRAVIVVGGSLTALGALGASFLPGSAIAAAYLAVLLVAVTGQVLAFVAQSDLLVVMVGAGNAGASGGLFTASSQVGGGLGLAALAIVADSTGTASGYPPEFLAACLLAVFAVLFIISTRRPGAIRAGEGV